MSKELKKEQLEDVPTEVESKKEDDVVETPEEKPTEEVKEEEPETTEEVKEEPKETEEAPKEEVVEEPKEEKAEEDAPEKEEDIKETKEELHLITEVRDELVALYAKNKDIKVEKEQLSKEVEKLSTDNKELTTKLDRYVKAEEQLMAKERGERLEQLSSKFKLLGQEKTVEQLSEKTDEALTEFESIVDAALDKAGEIKPMPEVTEPSQGTEKVIEDTPSKEVPETKEVNPLTKAEVNSNFFKGICKELTTEQVKPTRGSRAKFM